MSVELVIEGDYLYAYTPYDKKFIQMVKEIGAHWSSSKRAWYVTLDLYEDMVKIVEEIFGEVEKPPKPEKYYLGRVNCDGNVISIKTKYDPEIVGNLKSFSKHKWDNNLKIWIITPTKKSEIVDLLGLAKTFKWKVVDEDKIELLMNAFDEAEKKKRELYEISKANKPSGIIPLPPGLTLYPYQEAGVAYIEKTNGRTLLADEMGLGKTIQTIAYMLLHPNKRPVIVVCPSAVAINWEYEINRWSQGQIKTRRLKTATDNDYSGDVIIVSYSILTEHLDNLKRLNAKILVLDEAHYVKNRKAIRTRSAIELSKDIPHIIALTGTPILNRPCEIWTILHMLQPSMFKSFAKFGERYCKPHTIIIPGGRMIKTYDGADNLNELNTILRSTVMIRRLKEDVLKDLPAKARRIVPIEPDEEKFKDYKLVEGLYKKFARGELVLDAETEKKLIELVGVPKPEAIELQLTTKLRQLAAECKLEGAIEWIHDFDLERRKLVVFAHHRFVVDRIKEEFKPYVVGFSGVESAEERQNAVSQFTNDLEKRLFITTFGAGSAGINLQVASDVMFLELPWRPADFLQAEDRIHRIGQINKTTTWTCVIPKTIDEKLGKVLNDKVETITEALDAGKIIEDLIRFEEETVNQTFS